MRKKIFIVIGSLLLIVLLYRMFHVEVKHYFIKKHAIFWSENVELQANDFQADIDINSKSEIYWYHGLYLKVNSIEDAIVYAYFDKNKSWVKDTTYIKEYRDALQLRFDIYESYARKYNYEIDKVRDDEDITFSDLNAMGNSIHNDIKLVIDSIRNTDLHYEEKIKYWRPKVNALLRKYEKK